MPVYLIHFDDPSAHARHYLGYSRDVPERLERHGANRGARLLQICQERGVAYKVVRVWPNGDRGFERRLKRRKNTPALCPVCSRRVPHPYGETNEVVTDGRR